MISQLFNDNTEDSPDPDYLCSLFTAIDTFAQEMAKQKMRKVEMGNIHVFSVDFEDFNVLVTVGLLGGLNEADVEAILETIGFKFLEKHYKDLYDWNGDLRVFEGFDDFCKKVVELRQDNTEIQPSKIVDAITLLELESRLKKTAEILLELGEGTVKEIMERSKITSQTQQNQILLELVNQGYVGKKSRGKKTIYYVS